MLSWWRLCLLKPVSWPGFSCRGIRCWSRPGLLASAGDLNVYLLLAELSAAAIIGDTLNYSVGRKLGPRLFNREDSIFYSIRTI